VNPKLPKNNILPVWQQIGQSTNHLTKLVGQHLGVKTSHTGTLDPMAEGVVIVLCDDKRLKKIELASWKKTYEFEIAFGIQTDSFDGLGLIKKVGFKMPSENSVEATLRKFVGSYTQTVPIYSAIKYQGKKLFKHANAGTKVDTLPTKSGTIFRISLLGVRKQTVHSLIDEIIKKIAKVEGPLRQAEITAAWEKLKCDTFPTKELQIAKILAQTSRGMYVRSLSQDICKAVDCGGFVSSLVRTRNGAYNRKSCYNAGN